MCHLLVLLHHVALTVQELLLRACWSLSGTPIRRGVIVMPKAILP